MPEFHQKYETHTQEKIVIPPTNFSHEITCKVGKLRASKSNSNLWDLRYNESFHTSLILIQDLKINKNLIQKSTRARQLTPTGPTQEWLYTSSNNTWK